MDITWFICNIWLCKKNNERERKKEREQEMPIFVLSSKCKSVQSQYECRKKITSMHFNDAIFDHVQ